MLPVEIVPVDGTTIVLRARGSELLILPQHIGQLKGLNNPKEFTGYFLSNALLNRPARKLFEAWLRKDKSLWQRIYKTIQSEMDSSKIADYEKKLDEMKSEKDTKAAPVATEKKVAKVAKKAASSEKETKSVGEKKTVSKTAAEKKPAKKTSTETKAAPKKKAATPVKKSKKG